MTIQEYIEACEGLNVPNYALSDINWDLERRFISLYETSVYLVIRVDEAKSWPAPRWIETQ
jgi:hypothetical protein